MTPPPPSAQVLIIGAGPAGSYAASVLAREGLHVTVFEADKFPRYHIGESLIPSVRPYFRFIDAESTLASHGFIRKPGSAIKFNQFKREGYTDFVALGHDNNAWNVVRSEFDQMLMNHARTCGASVYEQTKVTAISFSDADPSKPISVTWSHTPPPPPLSPPASPKESSETPSCPALNGTTTFTYLIDATGRAGIMSTKYLKNRHFNESLKNIAVWGYWKDVGTYGIGTPRQGAPWFEALTDESGWAWFIPLHNGTTSVGVVMNQKVYNDKSKLATAPSPFAPLAAANPTNSTMVARYLSNLASAPGLVTLITAGHMIQGSVKSATDFSYSAPSYAGSHYRIIGDAGAFIDPFFSSGIHLALTSALSAAATICASIRGECSEPDAAHWHTSRVATSYTRFQIVVLSAYKQIRAQDDHVLSDVDEENFDRAFAFLRPVIQGAADMGIRLSENELQKSLDFCKNIFNPTSPEDHERVSQSIGVGRELLDVAAPVMDPSALERPPAPKSFPANVNLDPKQSNAEIPGQEMVLAKVNARRVIHQEYAIHNMESEPLNGYVMHLESGKLGLVPSAALRVLSPTQ